MAKTKAKKANKAKKEIDHPEHPSLKGYIPSEPIPEGLKLEMVFYPVDGFAVEWLVPIAKEMEKAA